ncbi:hypothetical protein NB311A_10458 [Nitrobacter sp. Nb-311A]|nr:hypothetical protein NB311A_10458 [Nitrobacter sp. Nb-311A]
MMLIPRCRFGAAMPLARPRGANAVIDAPAAHLPTVDRRRVVGLKIRIA